MTETRVEDLIVVLRSLHAGAEKVGAVVAGLAKQLADEIARIPPESRASLSREIERANSSIK